MNLILKKNKFILLVLIFLFLFSFSHTLFAEWEDFGIISGDSIWATSSFQEILNGQKIVYGPEALFDENPDTPWVEDVEGSGAGESVTILTQQAVTGVTIINGFASSERMFLMNNRVKTASIKLYAGFTAPGMVSETNSYLYLISDIAQELLIELEDSRKIQHFIIPVTIDKQFELYLDVLEQFKADESFLFKMMLEELGITSVEAAELINIQQIIEIYGFYGLRITIEDVYKGIRYDDTCISEIKVETESF